MEYVLMREEREVLAFDVDLSSGAVGDVRPLEDASWAPFGVFCRSARPESGLSRFIDNRSISVNRPDLPDILQATGARNQIELSFLSGGFSLSDPYWYRARDSALTWERGNFFDNDWDPSFGEAVLRGDYDALRSASPVTPDVTSSGASRKAWLRDAQGTRLVKGPVVEGCASVVGEVLASRMLARLLPEGEFVPYKLVERDGVTYSACRPMVRPGEELAFAWQVLAEAEGAPEGVGGGGEPAGSGAGTEPEAGTDPDPDPDAEPRLFGNELLAEFDSALARLGIEESGRMISKMMVYTHLAFNRDMHVYNLGVIRSGSGALRPAPLFDFDRTFCLSQPERVRWVCTNPAGAIMMTARLFSNLDPSWDYSWYDGRALDGFEYEVERALSACEVLPAGFAKITADLFAMQRAYVNGVAAGEAS